MTLNGHADVIALVDRAQALVSAGDTEAGVALYDEVLHALPSLVAAGTVAPSMRAWVLDRKATALNAEGDTYEAVPIAREAFALVEELYASDEATTLRLTTLVGVNLARLLVAAGEDDEAFEVGERVLPLLRRLYQDDDRVTALDWQGDMLGMLSRAQPSTAGGHGLSPFDVASLLVDTQRLLVAAEPQEPARRYDLAKSLQIQAPVLFHHYLYGEHVDDDARDAVLTQALHAGEEAVGILSAMVLTDPDTYVTDLAQAVCAYAGVLWANGQDGAAEALIERQTSGLPTRYATMFPTMVQAWEWISAPTFGKEESVLAEYEEHLLSPSADEAIGLMLGCVGSSEESRLAAIRRAARDLGVPAAYERRASDPVGFLFMYG